MKCVSQGSLGGYFVADLLPGFGPLCFGTVAIKLAIKRQCP